MSDAFGRPERRRGCPTCGAIGFVVKPYCLTAAAPSQVEWAPEGAIRAFPIGSAYIFDACAEAVELANAHQRQVAFTFYGPVDSAYAVSHVIISPGDDPDQRARDWWQGAYGETPEQTRSRR